MQTRRAFLFGLTVTAEGIVANTASAATDPARQPARLSFYASGGDQPVGVFADAGLQRPLGQPLECDADGRTPPLFFGAPGPIRCVARDALGRVLHTIDPFHVTEVDATLRSDLSADDGTGHITFRRGDAPGAFGMPLRDRLGYEVLMMDWVSSPALRSQISYQAVETSPAALAELGACMQRALDEAPLGCDLILHPGDWRIGSTLRLSRQLNLLAPSGARIVGFFGASRTDLIQVRFAQGASGAGDARRARMEGFNAWFASGGQSVIDVRNQAPMASNLHMSFRYLGLGAGDDSPGAALRFAGVVTQLHVVEHCGIDNQVWLDGCADSVAIRDCLMGGVKPAVRLDLAEGAFRTLVEHNTIVARDGAVEIIGGAEIDIVRNQMEQPHQRNQGAHGATIQVSAEGRDIRRVNIIGNNFGGGRNVETNIDLRTGAGRHVDDTFIDLNTFNACASGSDIRLNDAAVRWTRVGPNNTVRGSREGVSVSAAGIAGANTLDARVAVLDRGLGTMGTANRADALRLANSWSASPGFSFTKGLDGLVVFAGTLIPGVTAPGTTIGVLPPGFRPAEATHIGGVHSAAGDPPVLKLQPSGEIIVVSARAPLQPGSFLAPLRTAYDPGP